MCADRVQKFMLAFFFRLFRGSAKDTESSERNLKRNLKRRKLINYEVRSESNLIIILLQFLELSSRTFDICDFKSTWILIDPCLLMLVMSNLSDSL